MTKKMNRVSTDVKRTSLVDFLSRASHEADTLGETMAQCVLEGRLCESEPLRKPHFGSCNGLVVSGREPEYRYVDEIRITSRNLLSFTDREIARGLGYCIKDNYFILKYLRQVKKLRQSRWLRFKRRLTIAWASCKQFCYI